MMKYKNLFIDLDDTLWDTYHNNKECLEEIYTDHHLDRYYASFEAFFDIYWPHNELLWKQYRAGEIDRQTLIVDRFRYVLRPLGIEDTKSVLAVNNDFLQRTTTKDKKLRNSGLAPYFTRMILSEDAGIQKPHKGIFDFALINTNSRRSETLMIGDCFEADIFGAHQSKIDQLWFNPQGLSPQEFIPTYTVKSLEEIKGIL